MHNTRRIASGLLAVLLSAGAGTGCDGQDAGGLDDDRLRVMIDSLLPGIAEASGLEVRRSVSFAVQPRSEVRSFIEGQLRDELTPEELDGMDRVYKGLGLLPDTLDLRALLLELYTEQVVGYYDPRTDRLYVVEGATPETVAPVVAHELVHALQDQHADLDSLVARERGNDRQVAAQAAAEGQATLVMMALQASQLSGQPIDPGSLPDLGPLLRPALEAENQQYPVFQNAPRIIQETLLFPYLSGAAFVQELFRAHTGAGVPVPFGPQLPQSTEQVMNPRTHFLADRDAPTELTLSEPDEGWEAAYSNTLGQLEVGIFLTEHLGDGEATADGWDGDRYVLLRGPADRHAVVWYSVWDDDAAADRFADAYRRTLGARPSRVGRVERAEVGGRPVVTVVEADREVGLDAVPVPALLTLEERPEM